LADNKDFKKRHPDTSYKSEYPMNRVMVTESGHEMHWDDTKGNERIRLAHMSGTYFEMSPDGRRVDMTTGHHAEYAKGGHTFTSDKNVDKKVHGSDRESVSGHKHQEVKGDYTSATGKDRKHITGGDSTTVTKGDSTHGTVGDYLEHVGGSFKSKVDGTGDIKVTGAMTIESATSITLKVGGSTIVMTSGSIVAKSPRIDLN
jgi:hypothetical protein